MLLGSRTSRVSMFVLAGWLFADLFIGLALLFMVGNTQKIPIIQPTPTATLPPTPTPTPPPPPSIDPNDLSIQLTVNNPSAIISQDPASVKQLLSEIDDKLSAQGDLGRRVGIVLVYSGTTSSLAASVATILPAAGSGFNGAIYRQYFTQGAPYSALTLDIFFFR